MGKQGLAKRAISGKVSSLLGKGLIYAIQQDLPEAELRKLVKGSLKGWNSKYNTPHYQKKIIESFAGFNGRINSGETTFNDRKREFTQLGHANEKADNDEPLLYDPFPVDGGRFGGGVDNDFPDDFEFETNYWNLRDWLSPETLMSSIAEDPSTIRIKIGTKSWVFGNMFQALSKYPEMRSMFKEMGIGSDEVLTIKFDGSAGVLKYNIA